MIEIGGNRPAGWVYVASHPKADRFTKIGYSKWHPTERCFKYTNGFKRIHHLEFSLRAFGLGRLTTWVSNYHVEAESIEKAIKKRLKHLRRLADEVGTSREIFALTQDEAIAIVKEYI